MKNLTSPLIMVVALVLISNACRKETYSFDKIEGIWELKSFKGKKAKDFDKDLYAGKTSYQFATIPNALAMDNRYLLYFSVDGSRIHQVAFSVNGQNDFYQVAAIPFGEIGFIDSNMDRIYEEWLHELATMHYFQLYTNKLEIKTKNLELKFKRP